MRRLLDIAIAGAGLVIGAPVIGILAVAVRLESPGPALFWQTRVGRGRRLFKIVKLRTMSASSSGPLVTSTNDRRITRLGALLRRTKLDELPQLWNVVRGDMSIVGPRPEVPQYVERYRPEWEKLLSVRPGLTDLASLTFREEERWLALARDRERAYTDVVMPMKLQLALDGVERASVFNDLAVMANTARSIIRPRDPATDPIVQEVIRRIEALNRGDAR